MDFMLGSGRDVAEERARMRKGWTVGLLLVLALVAASGLRRVEFNTDVLSVLPVEMPEVRGLKAFQEMFTRDEELVLLLRTEDSGTLPARVRELAGMLEESGRVADVRWRPAWRDDPRALASLVGWLWLNGEPEELDALVSRLSEERVDATLQASLERVATALDGGSMMLSAHDPFGFLDHSSMAAFFQASEHGGEGFESADGRAHLMFIDAPTGEGGVALDGYRELAAWVDEVRAIAEPWAEQAGISLEWTGDPAFEAEIGSAMEGDMSGTLGLTSIVIGVLFLVMQRRVGLLLGLGLVLGGVLAVAMGLAGWIYGELSIMAAGFAAILVGLAVDYGVLICQEAKVADHDGAAIRRATARSIVWAAATTAAVFFALNLSGLPGIAQLGTIVALGVIAGALLMLVVYLPWVAWVGGGRAGIGHKHPLLPAGRRALAIVLLLVVPAVSLLAWRGLPGVEFDRGLLRPRESPAMAGFERIQEAFPEWGSPALKLVVEGDDGAEVEARLKQARERLERVRERHPGLVQRVEVPRAWWPSPSRMERNRPELQRLADSRERLIEAADEAGFSEEGTALGRAVLEVLPEVLALEPGELPRGPAVTELMRTRVMQREGGGGRVLGTVEVEQARELEDEEFAALREVSGEGVYLAGWALLKPAVLPLVRQDLTHVFLPMAGLMVVMLSLVFRRAKDVVLALSTMALSGLLLLVAMRTLGLQWNFLNIAATPLLLGTGLDYTIHILLAMRRTGGDLKAVWNGTAKAVLFCGTSTAIGFGSLAFASIDALASLGKVAVIGILISMSVSALLLPGISLLGERKG